MFLDGLCWVRVGLTAWCGFGLGSGWVWAGFGWVCPCLEGGLGWACCSSTPGVCVLESSSPHLPDPPISLNSGMCPTVYKDP